MGAKKKEIKLVAPISETAPAQAISRVYIPQKTKRTEMIEGTVDQQVERLAEVLKKEIRVV